MSEVECVVGPDGRLLRLPRAETVEGPRNSTPSLVVEAGRKAPGARCGGVVGGAPHMDRPLKGETSAGGLAG